jgi:hypothetical protein
MPESEICRQQGISLTAFFSWLDQRSECPGNTQGICAFEQALNESI